MKHYNVITPEMTTYYQDEPPEIWRDYVSVEAKNKAQAKVEAVRKFREKKSDWTKYNCDNPFRGLKAEEFKCPHGFCWCDICADDPEFSECEECLAEWEKKDNESRISEQSD